ncbi:hypothetical protein T484DRAFT_1623956, partial [Baffinella frigidus]
TLHPAPCTLNPEPCRRETPPRTMHPSPRTLNHVPSTLNPAPCTLQEGDTPLHLAALRGDAGAVAALLQGGAKSLNWRNPPGRTSPDYQRCAPALSALLSY